MSSFLYIFRHTQEQMRRDNIYESKNGKLKKFLDNLKSYLIN